MARTYRVRVHLPVDEKRTRYSHRSRHDFVLEASTVDKASDAVRAKLVANGFRVRTLQHAPADVIVVHIDTVPAAVGA